MGEGGATAPARRDITIRDLLAHRSGLSYGFLNGGPVGNAYRKEGVTDGLTTTSMTLEEGINKLAAQPLLVQPGSAWNYSLSDDVLGRVVEVASGQSFDVFLRERIIKPLGMVDTDFNVPRREVAADGDRLLARRQRRHPPHEGSETFGNTVMSPVAMLGLPEVFRAARASPRRRAITGASRRCWPTAASSATRESSARRRSSSWRPAIPPICRQAA
jgi:CubicO group peptidase (beta-lactamase class C family)